MEKEEKVYSIAVEQVQRAAMVMIGRELSEEEINVARKGLAYGIGTSLDIIYRSIFTEMI